MQHRLCSMYSQLENAACNMQAVAVFRAALAAPGPGLDASSFRAVAGILEAAGDWQQAVSIFEVMGARVCARLIKLAAAVAL
jgi:hypothetical protein